ncbi:UNVERIFIED_CONTAM: hypothetical protein FKN15_027818 [Acipenser sinensis]
MDRNALAELLQALESRRDAEERRREERYTALIERNITANPPPRDPVQRNPITAAPLTMGHLYNDGPPPRAPFTVHHHHREPRLQRITRAPFTAHHHHREPRLQRITITVSPVYSASPSP